MTRARWIAIFLARMSPLLESALRESPAEADSLIAEWSEDVDRQIALRWGA